MSRYIDANKLNGYAFGLISPKAQNLFHKIINNAPTEDVEPIVHGHWIKRKCEFYCSKCSAIRLIPSEKFCYDCGAKMDEKESEEKNDI